MMRLKKTWDIVARRLVVAVLAASMLTGMWPLGTPTVSAGAYGRGAYGNCTYAACNVAGPTTVTTPSGLEVAINLVDGQEIPFDGYTIIITPLNGEGASFAEARFYISGQLAQTVKPDETGTVRWKWDPREFPGTQVKIEIIDDQGVVTTKQFTVRIGQKGAQKNNAQTTSPPTGQTSGPVAVIQQVYHNLQKAVGALPAPIVNSFPYILFVLLGLNALVLFLQLQREIREYRTLHALLTRARALAEQKRLFIEIISHYLRTPLTVLSGGIELLQKDKVVASAQIDLQSVAQRMHTKIEQLITQIRQVETTATPVVDGNMPHAHFWRRPGLIVPLLLIGSVAICFDILAIQAKKFSHSEVQMLAQATIFVLLALTTYQVFRRISLRKRDRAQLEGLVSQEEGAAHTRDQLISDTLQALRSDLQGIEGAVPSLGVAAGSKFISDGTNRFRQVLAKFAVANQLRGSHSARPPVIVRLSDILQRAQAGGLDKQAQARQVTIDARTDVAISTPEPELLVLALHSLLDNAVAYSPVGGTVQVEVNITQGTVQIVVSDQGPGIPPEKLSHIFQPFYRVEGAENFTHEGMGFSLYLDRLIVTYLGGDIHISSEPQKGTQVMVDLPLIPIAY